MACRIGRKDDLFHHAFRSARVFAPTNPTGSRLLRYPRPRTSLSLTAALPRRDIGNASLRPRVRRPNRMGLPSDTLSLRSGYPDALTGNCLQQELLDSPLIDTMHHLVYTQPDGEKPR
jgi:hypothetical protein